MLRGAAREGHGVLVQRLLDARVCVHEASPRAETALHLAARGEDDHAAVCEMLVKAGADGFQYSTSGSRAYDLAVSSGSHQVRLGSGSGSGLGLGLGLGLPGARSTARTRRQVTSRYMEI